MKITCTRESLQSLVFELEALPRQGTEADSPEGSRYITMSDTLLKELIGMLQWHLEDLGV